MFVFARSLLLVLLVSAIGDIQLPIAHIGLSSRVRCENSDCLLLSRKHRQRIQTNIDSLNRDSMPEQMAILPVLRPDPSLRCASLPTYDLMVLHMSWQH